MLPEPRQRESARFPQEGASGGARRAASLPGAVEGRRGGGGGGGCCFSSCFSCASSSAMARPSFSLAACEVIGFDLDHTLCRYHLVESARLIYDSFAQYLVKEKGYDKELLNVSPESWDFCFKGLVLDMEDGNFLKLAEDGTVLRASHGTKHMTSEEILDTYGRKEWRHFKTMSGMVSRSAKYFAFDNYFDLPGALLCARIVDGLNKHSPRRKYDFWKDIVAAIQHNYKTSAFKEWKEDGGRVGPRPTFLSANFSGWLVHVLFSCQEFLEEQPNGQCHILLTHILLTY